MKYPGLNNCPPGAVLDGLIAENVMGFKKYWPAFGDGYQWLLPNGIIISSDWSPSTDMKIARYVIEKLLEIGWTLRYLRAPDSTFPSEEIVHQKEFVCQFEKDGQGCGAYAPTAPHAICLAALQAVQNESTTPTLVEG